MKIATIMSVYGADDPQHFADALDSILSQKFTKAIESRIYLAADGFLSEELWRVISERVDRIYKIVKIEKNKGLAVALNILIRELQDEEFIFRMDSDDVAFLDRYQDQIDFFMQRPDVDILGADIIELDDATGAKRYVSFSRGPGNALNNLSKGVPVAHPTVCFRRRVVDQMGGYPISKTNEDIALWFKCASLGFRFDNVPKPLLYFRVSENFWERRGLKKSFNEFSCYVSGIWCLHGVTWKFVFPILRLIFRLSPKFISKFFYRSKVREGIRS